MYNGYSQQPSHPAAHQQGGAGYGYPGQPSSSYQQPPSAYPPYSQPHQPNYVQQTAPPYPPASSSHGYANGSGGSYQHYQHHQPPQPPQPPPQHIYQPPHQQQPPSNQPYNIGIDPNVFRGYYMHELRQLTFNSKPIINALTILASQHAQRMAPIVAQCLEEHIRQAHPTVKLPALYLLDSICKNLGPPYTVLFARSIDRIFLTAYREVDTPTKVKLEELLGTWRNGGQDGGELFKLAPGAPFGTLPPQRIIEDTLFPQHVQHSPPPNPNPSPPVPHSHSPPPFAAQPPQHPYARQQSPVVPPPTPPLGSGASASNMERAAVLFDLRKLLGIRREQSAANPYDKSVHDQVNTLQQLEQLILNTSLSAAQIAQIREQIAKLTPPAQQQPQAARVGTPPYPGVVPKLEAQDDSLDVRGGKRQRLMSPSNYSGARGTPPPSTAPMPFLGASASDLASLTSLLNPDIIRTASAQGARPSATPPLASTPIPMPVPIHAQPSHQQQQQQQLHPQGQVPPSVSAPLLNLDPNLLSSLANATAKGSATNSPVPGAARVSGGATATSAANKAINERVLGQYEQHRLHFRVNLHNSEIARYRPGCSALLHEAMPLRCNQCGNRYLDSPLGKERLNKDLDRHLRISKRYNEGIGGQRHIARSWFSSEEEWVLPASAIPPSEAVLKTEQAKKKAKETAELLNKTVPVPVEAGTNEEIGRCPICKESFKNEYSEEEEDWVWRNAVEKDGKIYHASCLAEQEGRWS